MPEWSPKWRNPYLGMTDRVVTEQAQVIWVGFYDFDGSFTIDSFKWIARQTNRSLLIFASGKGNHIIALDLTDWKGKLRWFETCVKFSESHAEWNDYILQRDNILRLNRKNGKWPVFKAAFKVRSASDTASSYHIELLKNRVPCRILHRLYPKLQKTYSFGLKRYISDPNGPFERVRETKQE